MTIAGNLGTVPPFLDRLVSLVVPPLCLACRAPEPGGLMVCDPCRGRLVPLRDQRCGHCGSPTGAPVRRCLECRGRRLTGALGRCTGLPVAPILSRARGSTPQVGLARLERLSNARGSVRAVRAPPGGRLVLVDDVYTTGATLDACARALLDRGADINHRSLSGATPLMAAVMAHRKRMISLLLDHGAKADIADQNGVTPLSAAAFKLWAPRCGTAVDTSSTSSAWRKEA